VIRATLYSDPACPWGYSAHPQHRFLEWRFGDQLDWRLVMISLRELPLPNFDAKRAVERWAVFRDRYGMPFSLEPKSRASATHRGCRAVVAAGLVDPGSEWRVMRGLHFAHFNTSLLLDDDDLIRAALRGVPGVDADAVVDRLDDVEVEEEYQRQRAESRTAAGTPIETQGKHSTSDGPVRFTAPSVVFETDGRRLDAGGWQTALSYDVIVANLDPSLEVRAPAQSPAPLLERFTEGLTTAEVATLLAEGPDYVPDFGAAEQALSELASSGAAQRMPLGNDALWLPADTARPTFAASMTVAAT
jgi:protein-disulfide isomerase-like protein with CxxC motif